MTNGKEHVVVLLLCLLWVKSAVALDTAQSVMLRVQQQLSVPFETARGEMKLYVYGDLHRHYTFTLARSWEPQTKTEHVRIDFESPIPLADAESHERTGNRYLLKRVAHKPPSQWMFMPSLRRTRILPYHPADRLLQSQLWFYDLTAITDLDDYVYQYRTAEREHPVIEGTPQGGVSPYTHVQWRLEQRGEIVVMLSVRYVTDSVTREADYSGYQEIAPGWFRPQRLVVRDGDTERTEITFREWRLNASVPDVFNGTALDTKSLSVILQGNGGQ